LPSLFLSRKDFEPVNEGAFTVFAHNVTVTPVGQVMAVYSQHQGRTLVDLPTVATDGKWTARASRSSSVVVMVVVVCGVWWWWWWLLWWCVVVVVVVGGCWVVVVGGCGGYGGYGGRLLLLWWWLW